MVQGYVANYHPRWGTADLALWDQAVGASVRRWVLVAGPPTVHVARKLFSYVGPFALHYQKGWDTLNEAQLWKPEVVEHWALSVNGHRPLKWQTGARSELRRVGAMLGPLGTWPAVETKIARSNPSVPYSRADEEAFRAAAIAGRGPTRQRKMFVAAACLGAGLSGTVLASVLASDVVSLQGDQLGIRITNDDGERVVPVRQDYANLVREACLLSAGGLLLGMSPEDPNAVNKAARLVSVNGLGYLRIARARSTWVLRHLENQTPLGLLFEMARPLSGQTVQRLARFVRSEDPEADFRRAFGA